MSGSSAQDRLIFVNIALKSFAGFELGAGILESPNLLLSQQLRVYPQLFLKCYFVGYLA